MSLFASIGEEDEEGGEDEEEEDEKSDEEDEEDSDGDEVGKPDEKVSSRKRRKQDEGDEDDEEDEVSKLDCRADRGSYVDEVVLWMMDDVAWALKPFECKMLKVLVKRGSSVSRRTRDVFGSHRWCRRLLDSPVSCVRPSHVCSTSPVKPAICFSPQTNRCDIVVDLHDSAAQTPARGP